MKISNNQSAREVYSLQDNASKSDQKASSKSVSSKSKADSLELSGDAFKFSEIREKVSSGFYDKPEVLDTLAKKLDKLIADNL